MSAQLYFHFTIGPVQGFVAQARRTRDFWAGSFLLSWLSGVAMVAVQKQQGEIKFPMPPGNYLGWICGEGVGDKPLQGAIPNRFKAEVPADFDAAQVIQVVREAWWQLACRVWDQDLKGVAGAATEEIWRRQHQNFWEISWILTHSTASDVLDRRKNWRIHLQQPEPGVKCMIMDGWQELSGAERPNNNQQQEFWAKVRAQAHRPGLETDLAEGERLCAIAFVKRRFARHFEGFQYNGDRLFLRGWKLPVAVPSVSYMAAVHWLETLLRATATDKIEDVLQAAKALSPDQDERETNIRCLEVARRAHPGIGKSLISLDAKVFFEPERLNAKIYPDQNKARNLTGKLKDLNLAPLSPFYAVLMMDGDALGSHMTDQLKQPKIAQALNAFTSAVRDIVYQNNGFLVYAGGDDVLAILPLEDAFSCADALRDEYLRAFAGTGIPSTLSGAIEFAHVKMPLGRVLADAHVLIDEVAKDGRGRNAIAVRVWKPGGCALEWGQPWKVALDADLQQVVLQQIAATFAQQEQKTPFSSKFFYKIRERFELLNPTEAHPAPILTEDQAISLLAADYLDSGVNDKREPKITLGEARALVQPLLTQCRQVKREVDPDGSNERYDKKSTCLEPDGALLVRFLAQKGIEQRGGNG